MKYQLLPDSDEQLKPATTPAYPPSRRRPGYGPAPASSSSSSASVGPYCPAITRIRLMTALGISLIATILLLLQCIHPGALRPGPLLCCGTAGQEQAAFSMHAALPAGPVAADGATYEVVVDKSPPGLLVAEEEDGGGGGGGGGGYDGGEDDEDDWHDQYDEDLDGATRLRYKHTKRRLPQALIIGVRKGGTRALLEFLNLHPAIQAEKREMHYFDDDVNYNYGLDWYRKKMPWSYADQITLEKTPAYFVAEQVPERVHQMNASIKLLVVVRDPVERTISDYMQIHSSKMEKGRQHVPFKDIVIDADTSQVNKNYKPIRRSIYHRHMERWLRFFDLSQFHLVNAENLVSRPWEELTKVETFLGLEHRLSHEHFYFNETKRFFCMNMSEKQKCLASSKGRQHLPVEPGLMQKLRDFFRPHNQKFYEMVGTNFGWP